MPQFTLSQSVYFDRKDNTLTFARSPGRVLVSKSGVTLSVPDLMAFLERYIQVDRENPGNYFSAEVTAELQRLGAIEPPRTTAPFETPQPQRPQAKTPVPTVPAAPPRKPAEQVKDALDAIKNDVLGDLGPGCAEDIARGKFDGTLRSMVAQVYREIQPQKILPQLARTAGDGARERTDRVAQSALATQAFGRRLNLTEEELFVLAKTALIHGLREQEREHLPVIKRNLLSEKPSPSFAKRLIHAYQELSQWLHQHKVDTNVTQAIEKSQFIYHDSPVGDLPSEAMVLAVTDAFLTLKESGEKLLVIQDILTQRLRLTSQGTETPAEHIPALIEESCYNEYRAACRKDLSGGDHCAFSRLSRNLCSLLIFDVSGHDAEASRIRNALVAHLPRIKAPTNPSAYTTAINEFLLAGGFPEDRFVSLLYGVIDLKNDLLMYANAGHNPPYLVRRNQVLAVKKNDLLLNIAPYQYSNFTLKLHNEDCLVFYTDGLTEARRAQEGSGELFGTSRL